MFKPRFVIVIPTFNRVKILDLCLKAVENQTIKPDQIVVVLRDNDVETKIFIENFITHSQLNFEAISVSKPGHIPPVVAGLNIASGDYVGLIDDDVLIDNDWVENSIEIFRDSSPRLGAITGPAICEEQNSRNVYPAKLSWFGRFSSVKNENDSSENINSIAEGNVVFRGEVIKKLAIDRRHYFGGIQHHGLDIGLQMLHNGWFLKYSPQIKVGHLPRKNDKTEYEKDVLNYIGNLTFVIKKNLSAFFCIRFAIYNFFVGQHFFPGLVTCVLKKEIGINMVFKAQGYLIREFLTK